MHKFPIPIAHDIRPTKHRWSLLRAGAIVLLGISLAPLIAEGTSICIAQWSRVMGRNAEARTPMIDSLQDGIESGHRSFSDAITAYFQRLPWSPKVVLVVGVILMMLAMMMLKCDRCLDRECECTARPLVRSLSRPNCTFPDSGLLLPFLM